MASQEDVNRQHMAAAGLDPEGLGQPVPKPDAPAICESYHYSPVSDSTVRCQRKAGHLGSHAHGRDLWRDSGESTENWLDAKERCSATKVAMGSVLGEGSRCAYVEGHYGDHYAPEVGFWLNADLPVREPTKQRDGDQVLPQADVNTPCVQDRIIAEMEESKRVGLERYGSVLRTFNGRRSIQDVREEARDLFVYLTQVQMEVEATRETLVALAASVIDEKVGALFSGQTGQNVAQEVAEAVVDRLLGHFTQDGES